MRNEWERDPSLITHHSSLVDGRSGHEVVGFADGFDVLASDLALPEVGDDRLLQRLQRDLSGRGSEGTEERYVGSVLSEDLHGYLGCRDRDDPSRGSACKCRGMLGVVKDC